MRNSRLQQKVFRLEEARKTLARGAEAEVAALFGTTLETDLMNVTGIAMATGEEETTIPAVVTVTAMGAAGMTTREGEKNSAEDLAISADAMTTGAIAMIDTAMVGAAATIGEMAAAAVGPGALGVTATAR